MERTGPEWRRAEEAAERAGVDLVPVDSMEDILQSAGVLESLWGEGVLPPELIRAFQHAGSVLHAARAEGQVVGFVLGFLGTDEGLHVHSHILGVLPGWQSRGVGYALKLAQRAASLDHRIDEVRWTYDPLIARNARFNLVKLGALGVRLLPSFYGEMRDQVNRGDRSDRFEVRWRLRSERVMRALDGRPVDGEPVARGGVRGGQDPPGKEAPMVLDAVGDPGTPQPVERAAPEAAGALVAIPGDYLGLRSQDPGLARRWREASAHAFRACFDRGLLVTGISRDDVYRFEPPEPER